MVDRFDRDDPECNASYRAAVRVAARQGIVLTARRDGGQSIVSAMRKGDGSAPIIRNGPTPADAAWHALAALEESADEAS